MQSHFLIITGMSGAGKTQVVRTLEDLNFFCIDNLPATLIPKFAELCRQTSEEKVALVVDIRGGRFFDKLLQVLDEMEASGQNMSCCFGCIRCNIGSSLQGNASSSSLGRTQYLVEEYYL